MGTLLEKGDKARHSVEEFSERSKTLPDVSKYSLGREADGGPALYSQIENGSPGGG
jgi:hypothetical protein